MANISTAFTGLAAEVAEIAVEFAPRRFALCWVDEAEDDGGVLGWGLQLRGGHAVVCGESGGLGTFESAEAARRLFSQSETVTLVWLDER